MGRRSKRDDVTEIVREYLAQAVFRSPDEYPLDVGSVAAAIGCARSTIYNYSLQGEIAEAAELQRQFSKQSHKNSDTKQILLRLRQEIRIAEQRNRSLLERLMLVEANAARLGIDPEELYKPLLKPPRMASNAGRRR